MREAHPTDCLCQERMPRRWATSGALAGILQELLPGPQESDRFRKTLPGQSVQIPLDRDGGTPERAPVTFDGSQRHGFIKVKHVVDEHIRMSGCCPPGWIDVHGTLERSK